MRAGDEMELSVEVGQPPGGDELGEPLRFGRPGSMQDVAEVLDRWLGEDHRYFRVRTRDGAQYVLRHDTRAGTWQIAFFESELEGTAIGAIDPHAGP